MEMIHACYFDIVKVEILDSQITEGMLAAEKECLITYRLPWDEITHDLMTQVNILKIVILGLKTGIDNEDLINNKMNILKEPIDLPTTIKDTNKELRELTRRQRQLIRDKQSYNMRTYQEREKAFCEAYKKTMSEKRAKAIFKGKEEIIKLMKSTPKSGKKQKSSGPLSCALVPLPKEGIKIEWHAVTDGPTIQKLILESNIKHFSQAEDTPLATKKIIELIGPGGDTEFVESILDRTANLTQVTKDETSQRLLSIMRRNDTVDMEITKEEMMD